MPGQAERADRLNIRRPPLREQAKTEEAEKLASKLIPTKSDAAPPSTRPGDAPEHTDVQVGEGVWQRAWSERSGAAREKARHDAAIRLFRATSLICFSCAVSLSSPPPLASLIHLYSQMGLHATPAAALLHNGVDAGRDRSLRAGSAGVDASEG